MSGYEELKRMAEGDGMACMTKAELRVLIAENERLQSKTGTTMGVGSGDGQLFVHGDHDSIKAAQAIVLERDQLKAEVARSTEREIMQLAEIESLRADRNELIAAIEVLLLHVKPAKMNAVALNHAHQVISKYKVKP